MYSKDIDCNLNQATFITTIFLKEGIKTIDSIFGNDFAKNNPTLLGEFISSASRNYHALLNGTLSTGNEWMISDQAAIAEANQLNISTYGKSAKELRFDIKRKKATNGH